MNPKSDILLSVQKGWLTCPACHKKLQRVDPDTEASHLPVWCPRCRIEYQATIHRDRSAHDAGVHPRMR